MRVTCLRGRTSDRTDGAGAGAQALCERLGGRVIGEPGVGRARDWSEDLPEARPVLETAAAELTAALDQAELPVLTASDCSICIATLPTVVAPDEFDGFVRDWANRLAAKSPVMMRLGKDALFRQQDMALDDALEFLHAQLTLAFSTDDIQEGVRAFFEKRDPVWTGR